MQSSGTCPSLPIHKHTHHEHQVPSAAHQTQICKRLPLERRSRNKFRLRRLCVRHQTSRRRASRDLVSHEAQRLPHSRLTHPSPLLPKNAQSHGIMSLATKSNPWLPHSKFTMPDSQSMLGQQLPVLRPALPVLHQSIAPDQAFSNSRLCKRETS